MVSIKKKNSNALRICIDYSKLNNITISDPMDGMPEFQDTKTVVTAMKVVNDAAERSVALMNTVNQSIPKTDC
jgi:hypothetical protein